jgi:hypothetical protein
MKAADEIYQYQFVNPFLLRSTTNISLVKPSTSSAVRSPKINPSYKLQKIAKQASTRAIILRLPNQTLCLSLASAGIT